MHGVPPNDFPSKDLSIFFRLHSQLESSPNSLSKEQLEKYDYLEKKMRDWPRTRDNDPYFFGSLDIANHLESVTQRPAFIGFNEFCSPTLLDAFSEAVQKGATKITVVTTMLTRGGEHSEKDIPTEIEKAKEKFPYVSINYLWPISSLAVAAFLNQQLVIFEDNEKK